MKTKLMILSAACLLAITVSSCNDDGNTGNGANDPTSTYEPNNIKEPEDVRLQTGGDSLRTTVDTTTREKQP